jgi:hypothetical protein
MLILCVVAGCQDGSSSYQAFTYRRLEILGKVACRHTAEECVRFRDLSEFVEESKKRGFIVGKDAYYVKDFWERDMRWEVHESDGETILRILSAGENGIFEDGGRDDLAVVVTFPKSGPPTSRMVPR